MAFLNRAEFRGGCADLESVRMGTITALQASIVEAVRTRPVRTASTMDACKAVIVPILTDSRSAHPPRNSARFKNAIYLGHSTGGVTLHAARGGGHDAPYSEPDAA